MVWKEKVVLVYTHLDHLHESETPEELLAEEDGKFHKFSYVKQAMAECQVKIAGNGDTEELEHGSDEKYTYIHYLEVAADIEALHLKSNVLRTAWSKHTRKVLLTSAATYKDTTLGHDWRHRHRLDVMQSGIPNARKVMAELTGSHPMLAIEKHVTKVSDCWVRLYQA